ncbi:MAG: hypothetical protein LRS46_00475 [Desulfurococcales archaeon]|nr:hypothetical protein [Desulfurococcales archaeon]
MKGIDDNKRECLNRQRSILNTFEKLLRDIAKRESNYEAEAEIKNTHVKISVVPLPMALTYVCDNKTRIVTYRFSNAADRLTALLIVNMAYHILDKLYSIERSNYRPSGSGIGDGYSSLLVAIDLSHGVNYSSASLLQAYNSLSRWVGSLLDSRFGESGIRVEFKLYNSDPVKGGLDIASSEAYKIHLVSHIGLEASKLPQGYTQATVASILEEILKAGLNASNLENNIKSILKTIIKENVNISNLQNAAEHYELWLASTSLGLALWSIYFAERFAAELKDADLNDPLKVLSRLSRLWNSLQLEINPQKNKNLVNINVKATEDNDIILSMLHTPEALLLLLFALSIVLREGVKRELEKGCINLESYSSNFKVDNTNVHGVLVYSARDQDECDIRNYIRSLFNWLTHQSLAILEEEIIKEEKADEKKYGYMPGQIKERHLLAHAGLARGAAVLLEYAPARVGETGSVVILKRALLFDTDSLRSTLKKLAFERR